MAVCSVVVASGGVQRWWPAVGQPGVRILISRSGILNLLSVENLSAFPIFYSVVYRSSKPGRLSWYRQKERMKH
jgi:hypothetical protein